MQQKNNLPGILSLETVNLIYLSLVALVEGILFLIALCFVFHFVPVTSPFQGQVLNEWVWHLKPEREIFFYRMSVFFTVGLATILFLTLKSKLNSENLRQSLAKFLVIQTACLTIILFSLFKMAIYGNLPYFNFVSYMAFGIAVFTVIFWFKLSALISQLSLWLDAPKAKRILSGFMNIAVPILIVLLLFVPDRHSIFARIFVEDLLYHYDGIIMATGWAFLKGCKFYVDVISQYGMGMPMTVALLAKSLGKFSYENVITVLMCWSLAYLVMCYFFMKTWLRNTLISFIGLMLIIKFQMFHYGVSNPYIWKHPNNLAVRFFYDIPFLFFILLHIRTSLRKYLILACLCVGIALFHVTDTGAYLLATLFAYLVWVLVIADYRNLLVRFKRDLLFIPLYFLLPVVIVFSLFSIWLGGYIFTRQFWGNFTETAQFFVNGLFVLPMHTLIEEKYFEGYFAGFIVPLLYLFNLLFLGGSALTKKADKENIFPVILSIYGLCLYHYYVGRSSHTYFYVVIIPLVFILCFWLNRIIAMLSLPRRQATLILTAFFSFFALFMTQSFIEYPNILALKKISYEKERETLTKEYNFEKDAAFIDRLTAKDEKVALISSFETAILMTADRKPFFYYFPLVCSRYRNMKDFGGTYLFTQARLKQTLENLETQKPRYIFIEKKLLGGIPSVYYTHYVSLTFFVTYLRDKYIPQEQGEYLIVFKRKE